MFPLGGGSWQNNTPGGSSAGTWESRSADSSERRSADSFRGSSTNSSGDT